MGVFATWNLQRAAGSGLVAGSAAFVLWPAYSMFQGDMFLPFVLALLLSSFCGMSILIMTAIDIRNNRRGVRVRPIRAFDVILGFVLAMPSTIELYALLR